MRRCRVPELMDDPAVDAKAHRAALGALRRVNRWLGVDSGLVRQIHRLVHSNGCGVPAPFSMLEIGVGGGGLLVEASRALPTSESPAGVAPAALLIGLDRSPFALGEARRHTKGVPGSRFVAGDATRLPLADRTVDVVVCSLLLHHFDPPAALALLREAARVCRYGVVIGDLQRGYIPWTLTWMVTRLTARAHVFHVDGPRSVRAAYRPDEAAALAFRAGLVGAKVRRIFPFRWLLTWRRNDA